MLLTGSAMRVAVLGITKALEPERSWAHANLIVALADSVTVPIKGMLAAGRQCHASR